jgi:hypothetical protein
MQPPNTKSIRRYSLMLRIFKSYHTNLHNPLVHSKSISFSSRPGDLESKDDFYILSSNLVVIESSLNNYNPALFSNIKSDALPVWIRVNLANRIAENSEKWVEIFSKFNSGTHNNQWAIVNYNEFWRLKKENITRSQWINIVWLLEQFFDRISAEDVTKNFLVEHEYFATYNFPYDAEIFKEGNYGEKNPHDPREDIFRFSKYFKCRNFNFSISLKLIIKKDKNSQTLIFPNSYIVKLFFK